MPGKAKTTLFCDLIRRSPVGPVLVVCSQVGVAGVFLGCRTRAELVDRASAALGDDHVLRSGKSPTADARDELERYFAGELMMFSTELDLLTGTPFQQAVWLATARIPFGMVSSYGAIARRVGSPRACRAVGSALGRNILQVRVPAHRILSADGRIGGWSGDMEIKRKLLSHEGISA